MEDERWNRVTTLLQATLEQPEAEWATYLAAACGDDAVLFEEVESLLRADPEAVAYLEQPVGDLLTAKRWEEDLVGTRIGPYRLIRELGRGGLGVVYLAERADQEFNQQVAIKLLKREMESDEVLRRFQAERQILADLKHSNTAQLLDGGTTKDGRPYFVMEYIKGRRIDRYCDRKALSTQCRLELFSKVCAVVHFAHQNLVVHRDLKPGNILVTDQGEPKLLDFGIARLLTHDPTKTALLNDRRLTPAYASPEQIRGETVRTTSDVYSLGVVLYELLTGRRPYYFSDQTEAEFRRVISEGTPLKPSLAVIRTVEIQHTTVSGTPVAVEAVAKARGENPRSLQRRLAGDIDNIVLKVLCKKPKERYSSVEQLSEDIQRHLDGQPVRARAATPLYRVNKFARRNVLSLSVALVFLFVILGSGASILWQGRQTEQERERAEQVTKFLIDLFEASDPYGTSSGEFPTTREVLDAGAARVDQELAHQPDLKASVQFAIGQIYRRLGLHEQAKQHLEAALPVFEANAERSNEKAETLNHLGILAKDEADYDQAQQRFDAALETLTEILTSDHPRIALIHTNLAELALERGSYALASEYMTKARAMFERTADSDYQEQYAEALTTDGYIQYKLGNYREAQVLYDQSLTLKEAFYGPEHPSIAATVNAIGLLLKTQGSYQDAEASYRRALRIREQSFGPEHFTVATSLNNLSVIFRRMRRFDEAETAMVRAITIKEKLYTTDHPSLARSFHNLGLLYREMERFDDAERFYRQALAMFEKTVGPEHSSVAGTLNNLGVVLYLARRFEEAEPIHLKALRLRRQIFAQNHPEIAESMQNLGALYSTLGRFSEAESLLEASLRVREKALGTDHPLTVLTREQYLGSQQEQDTQ